MDFLLILFISLWILPEQFFFYDYFTVSYSLFSSRLSYCLLGFAATNWQTFVFYGIGDGTVLFQGAYWGVVNEPQC